MDHHVTAQQAPFQPAASVAELAALQDAKFRERFPTPAARVKEIAGAIEVDADELLGHITHTLVPNIAMGELTPEQEARQQDLTGRLLADLVYDVFGLAHELGIDLEAAYRRLAGERLAPPNESTATGDVQLEIPNLFD